MSYVTFREEPISNKIVVTDGNIKINSFTHFRMMSKKLLYSTEETVQIVLTIGETSLEYFLTEKELDILIDFIKYSEPSEAYVAPPAFVDLDVHNSENKPSKRSQMFVKSKTSVRTFRCTKLIFGGIEFCVKDTALANDFLLLSAAENEVRELVSILDFHSLNLSVRSMYINRSFF
jgi:hypothetical protein